MKKVFVSLLFGSLILAACPDSFTEDDCGNCWLPYCYDFTIHVAQYDLNEEDCNGQTQMWVNPGDQGDPYYNN